MEMDGQFQDMLSLLSFHESSIDRRFWVDSTDGDFLVASFFMAISGGSSHSSYVAQFWIVALLGENSKNTI